MQKEANFLTITQAAQFLKVYPDTLRRWEAKGIVTPARTRGGSRRYTLLDLKIAKLNKRKREQVLSNQNRFFQIPTLLKQNYINSKRDLKIALLTSFLWIFALSAFHFLTPVFLKPTSPEQQIASDQLKEQGRLNLASETAKSGLNAITALVVGIGDLKKICHPEAISRRISHECASETSSEILRYAQNDMSFTTVSQGADLLIRRLNDLPALKYTETLDQYYSLKPLPQNQIPSLIISKLTT